MTTRLSENDKVSVFKWLHLHDGEGVDYEIHRQSLEDMLIEVLDRKKFNDDADKAIDELADLLKKH